MIDRFGKRPGAKIWERSSTGAVIQFDGFDLRITGLSLPDGTEGTTMMDDVITAETSPLSNTFRSAHRLIPRVAALFEDLTRQLDGDAKFVMTLVFDGTNPYFGFYLQKVATPMLSRFRCEFREGSAQDNVTITERAVTIVCRTPTTLVTLGHHYLGLGPAPYGLLHDRAVRSK